MYPYTDTNLENQEVNRPIQTLNVTEFAFENVSEKNLAPVSFESYTLYECFVYRKMIINSKIFARSIVTR